MAELSSDSKVTFKFYGSQIRLMEAFYNNRSRKGTIKIDGNAYAHEYCSAHVYSVSKIENKTIFYEKTGLEKKIHNVEISLLKDEGYWFTLDCMDIDEDGYLIKDDNVLNIEPEKDKVSLNENVTANVVIENIKEIAAEDMIIKYDSDKLKFLGADAVDGIKIVKDDESEGQLRMILASQGKANIANDKNVLLKLNFQAIAAGDALVDITKGKISDGIEMERDLDSVKCAMKKYL